MLELGSLLSTAHDAEGEEKGERARHWQGVRKGETWERRVSLWKLPEANKEEPCSPPEDGPTRCRLLLQGRLVLGRDSVWIDRILLPNLLENILGGQWSWQDVGSPRGIHAGWLLTYKSWGLWHQLPPDSNAHCKTVLRVTGNSYCLGQGLGMSSWYAMNTFLTSAPPPNQRACTCI